LKYFFSIYLSGNINDDLDFEYGDGADARYGCGATLMDEYWYFGDDNKVNIINICNSGSISSGLHFRSSYFTFQASKIVDCKLTRQADLSFSFSSGSCNTFMKMNSTPTVLLCFGDYRKDYKDCHT